MQTNFLVIGSGISGLNFALHAAKKGHVTIVTKKKIAETNTNRAQGGIAAVIDSKDSFAKHIEDTLQAGAFHNDKKAVKFMVEKGPEAITRLIELGVEFEQSEGTLKLTREGGHSSKRISYVGDFTGQEIESILVKRVRNHPNIDIFENTFAVDLIVENKQVYGAKIIIRNHRIDYIFADAVIIATGGSGQAYKYTTNPSIATGDGIAMAYRAGAKIKDMEFIQFHPTAFALGTTPKFLLSEALRGEGAKLINNQNESFINELSPRDIVARAIYKELQNGPVYLQFKNTKSPNKIKSRFPKIYEKLKKYDLDLTHDKIPVIPVAHYICGGIKTDLRGRTNIKNLYAFGETTCTGVHGANRLASNSLLEAVVFSNQVVKDVKPAKKFKAFAIKHETLTNTELIEKKSKLLRREIQETMWEYCGIVRAQPHLNQGLKKLLSIKKDLESISKNTLNRNLLETKNLLETSILIIEAARKRKSSLGCHFVGGKGNS